MSFYCLLNKKHPIEPWLDRMLFCVATSIIKIIAMNGIRKIVALDSNFLKNHALKDFLAD